MRFFDAKLFEKLRSERGVTWGRPVRAYEQCASTNDLALQAILSEAKTGIVYLAREQLSGRGRRGRSWVAQAGDCLMFSVLLRFPKSHSGTAGLSLAIGLALHDVVIKRVPHDVKLKIKWPNDLYAGDKKLAGILIESRSDQNAQLAVVVGIGLNWKSQSFPPELSSATSLALLGAADEALESLLVDLLRALELRVTQFLTRGIAEVAKAVNDVDFLKGRVFSITQSDNTLQKVVGAGIDATGQLIVQLSTGELLSLNAAELVL